MTTPTDALQGHPRTLLVTGGSRGIGAATALLAVIGSHFAYRKKSAVLNINLKAPQAFAVAAIRQGVFDTQLPSAGISVAI